MERCIVDSVIKDIDDNLHEHIYDKVVAATLKWLFIQWHHYNNWRRCVVGWSCLCRCISEHHCDNKSFHINHVRISGQHDATIDNALLIDDIMIVQLFTF